MAATDNKKKTAELKALRDRLNDADRRKHYDVVVESCLAIIALGGGEPSLNILTFLYHKDLAMAYMKLHEHEKALASFNAARTGLLHHRATQKLKYPEDWLNELKAIEKQIHKIETVYLK